MRNVWLWFKLIEALISILAVGVHIWGILHKDEPIPHGMIFCGTYFAYTLISICGFAMYLVNIELNLVFEAVTMSLGAALFLIGSLVSMYNAEHDFHLMFLSEKEESEHEFFVVCKFQCLVSILGGMCFMLHTTFLLDALLVRPTETELASLKVTPADRAASEPLQLALGDKPILSTLLGKVRRQKDRRNDPENIDEGRPAGEIFEQFAIQI